MKKIISILLVFALLILPAGLIFGLSFLDKVHPLEGNEIKNDAFLIDSENDIELLFFGYMGCASVCPLSLAKLAGLLKSLDEANSVNRVGATFVDVLGNPDRSESLEYGLSFSKQIRGTGLCPDQFKKVGSEFNITVRPSFRDKGEYFHTDHFFLLHRKENGWAIANVLANDISEDQLLKRVLDLTESRKKQFTQKGKTE